MLNVIMEYRKGVLFIRLEGKLENDNKEKMKEIREVIKRAGIKYVVVNVLNVDEVDNVGIKEVKEIRKLIKKLDGEFFLFGNNIKELRKLVNLESELNVFGKVMI